MATAEARLDITIDRFARAMGQARTLLNNFGKWAVTTGKSLGTSLFSGALGMVSFFGNIMRNTLLGISALGLATGAALAAGLKKAFDAGGRLSDVASQTGMAAGEAMILEEAFTQAGIAAEKVPGTVNKLQRALIEARDGAEAYQKVFSELGLDPDALIGQDPGAAFATVARAIAAIPDPAERAARAMQIFGRAGGELLVMFNDSSALDGAATALGSQAALMTEVAGDFDRASDILGSLWLKVQGFFVGLGSKVVAQLLPPLEALNAYDFAPLGEKVGASLADGVDTLRGLLDTLSLGELMELAGLRLKLGFQSAVNWFVMAFGSALAALGLDTAWAGMETALLAIARKFRAELTLGLDQVAETLKMGGTGLMGMFGDKPEPLTDGRGNFLNGQDPAASGFKAPTMAEFIERFQAGMKTATGAFETGELEARIEELSVAGRQQAEAYRLARDTETANRRGGGGRPGPQLGEEEEGDTGGEKAPARLMLAGAFARAQNLLSGKSVNELIADETRKGNALLAKVAAATEATAAAIRDQRPPAPVKPEVTVKITPTFSGAR